MGCEMMGMGLAGLLVFIAWIVGLALAITWLFLPWMLMGKMDRMIELLETLAKKCKSE